MSVAFFVQLLVNAAQVSAIYALLSVSYVLIHAITQRINFAFGALSIWAGYTFINVAMWLLLEWPGTLIGPLIIAGGLALGHAILAGVVTETLVVRPLIRESSLAVLVTTLGLAIVLEEVMRIANDSRERWLVPILADPIAIFRAPGFIVYVTPVQLVTTLMAVALALGLVVFVARHPFGRAWRACSQDLAMAELCGVNVAGTLRMTFLVAAAYAAMAGILTAQLYGVASYSGGLVIGLKTLFVAVVGGLSSVPGVLIGAVVLGLLETWWSAAMGPEYRDVAAFLALAALMMLFPEGLKFGTVRRSGP